MIDLSSMETVPAEHLPTGADRADDGPRQRVESMRVGERHRIFLELSLEPRAAALAQRPQPLLPVRRRVGRLAPTRSPVARSTTQRGRADAAARIALAGAARGRQ